jgi:hypothetical protein
VAGELEFVSGIAAESVALGVLLSGSFAAVVVAHCQKGRAVQRSQSAGVEAAAVVGNLSAGSA